jgi:peptidoglycan/LPS O-acetylase OafA/YrhL
VNVPRPSTREAATGHTAGRNAPDRPPALRVDWLDPLKGFAILAVLLNHFVESVGPAPWFTNPSNDWPGLATRLHTFFPDDQSLPIAAVRTLGWLGDSGPGVFIFASGVGLTLAALSRTDRQNSPVEFYRRRLLRLFPLYIAMHFIVLGGDLAVPGNLLTFGSPLTLFSLTGFRGTASLFYYIASAWWYIWLIVQLYLAYPFLLGWLRRTGPAWFFAGTLAITIASRGAGIRYSPHLYMWMTGMFAGTRLAEFTAGMVTAWWLAAAPANGRKQPAAGRVVAWAAVIYVAGLACSVTLTGSLISNLLVTIGLSGLFYGMWRLLRAHTPAAAAAITVVGASSYAVYLLHQPLLAWTQIVLAGHRGPYFAAALIVLAASIPAGQAMERGMESLAQRGPAWLRTHATRLSGLAGIAVFALLLGVEPQTAFSSFSQRAVCFVIAVGTGLALWLEWLARPGGGTSHDGGASAVPEPAWPAIARRTGLVAGLAGLFLLPPGYGYLAAPAGLIVAVVATAAARTGARTRPPYWAWGAGIAGVLALFGAGELVLRRVAPREVGGWGERPALMVHPTRAFGLIPNRVTHLRYNDYDYVVRTNSMGLASPEIPAGRPTPDALRVLTTGDAFTMPEGLNYEQSFPALLDSALTRCLAPRAVQVINAGVTGYGPLEEEPQFGELGALYHPDIVVHEFYVNDWSDITVGTDERRQGIGLTGRRLTRGSLLSHSDLAANAQVLYERIVSALTGQISATQRYKLLLDYYRKGPNPLYDEANIERMTRFIAHFRDAARADGGTLVIFYTPGAVTVLPRNQIAYLPASGIPLTDSVHYDTRRPLTALEQITDSLGVPLVDLTGPLRDYRPQPVYYPNQWHWNAAGDRAAAAGILAALGRQGLIAGRCAP